MNIKNEIRPIFICSIITLSIAISLVLTINQLRKSIEGYFEEEHIEKNDKIEQSVEVDSLPAILVHTLNGESMSRVYEKNPDLLANAISVISTGGTYFSPINVDCRGSTDQVQIYDDDDSEISVTFSDITSIIHHNGNERLYMLADPSGILICDESTKREAYLIATISQEVVDGTLRLYSTMKGNNMEDNISNVVLPRLNFDDLIVSVSSGFDSKR